MPFLLASAQYPIPNTIYPFQHAKFYYSFNTERNFSHSKIGEIQVNLTAMKNSTFFLLACILFFSCAKETECPYSNTPRPPVATPPPPVPTPSSSVGVNINGLPMAVTSLTYNRQSGGISGIWITASNDLQKVTAVASPFTEFGTSGYTCKMEVSYFTRPDKGSEWAVSYPRVVPRDDKIMFNQCAPMRAKVLTGNFSGSFIESSGTKDEHRLYVTGDFSLVF